MGTVQFKTREERVAAVKNRRGRLNGWIILLMFCLCMFSSDAKALYSIFESGVSDVYGISDANSLLLDGDEFGSVIVIASDENAYSIYSSGGDITIDGLFDSVGIITASVGTNSNAFALFTPEGSIYTDGLDGTINAQAEDSYAIGLFSPDNDVNTADIGGTISAQVGNQFAAGLWGDHITTGDIDGTINAVASNDYAFGLYGGGVASVHTGSINGTIYAEATYGSDAYAILSDSNIIIDGDIGVDANIVAIAETEYAFGLCSDGGLINITGNIDGKITADVNDGDDAYAMYASSDIIVDGNIGSTALIGATGTTGVIPGSAYGMYSDGSIEIGDVNGTIFAEMTEGSEAYAIYAANDVTIGDIGSDANIWAEAEYGEAYGIYSGEGIFTLTTGDIAGKITAEVFDGTGAYAMYSETDIVVDGNITSTALIGATATGDGMIPESAYGMYSEGSIEIGDIDGTIYAEMTEGSDAYAIYAANDVTIGDIGSDANIWASANDGDAYGIYSGLGERSIHTGNIDGKISADVNDSTDAYAMYSETDIVIDGDIGSTAEITATAEYGYAYGMYTGEGGFESIHITGDVNGLISADVNDGSYAYGMYSSTDIEIDGDVGSDAEISATASEDRAYALYGQDSIETGDIDGLIFAETINGSRAYGMYSSSGFSIHVGDVNGTITADANEDYAYAMRSFGDITIGNIESDGEISATAGDDDAYAVYSSNGSIDINDIDGVISAETINGSDAYALYNDNAVTIYIDNINGTVFADANDSDAYAMYSYGDIIIDGNITGDAEIYAEAGQNDAYALYSSNGSIETGDIDGEISAETFNGSYAYAMYSGEGDSIHTGDVNGTITADANEDYAYAMRSFGDITIGNIESDGEISATAGDDDAYAVYSSNGSIDINDIDGVISAEALGGSSAYGLYSGGGSTIYTGDVNGVISAYADEYNARAFYSAGDIIIDGDITSDANISATAGEGTAYALFSGDGSIYVEDIDGVISAKALMRSAAYGLYSGGGDTIYTEDVNGVITAYADEGSAYGMYSSGDIIIDGDITSNAEITATTGSGYGYAYGIFSDGGGGSVHIEDINGVVTADSGDSYAYAIYSNSGIFVEDIGVDANISAIAEQDYAYAIYSSFDDVNTGDIDGMITAEAGSYYATGIRAVGGSVYTGDINGTITATAMDGYAYGLYSDDAPSIHVGDVNGTISAEVTSGSYAYGMYSTSSITTGDILSDALISATASDNYAYGLFSDGGTSIVTGDIDGTITATSGGDDAGGLVSTNSSVTTGDINGTISATAEGEGNDTAYGIYGNGSVAIGDVNGVISAEMTYGSGAYAIRSDTDVTTGDITSNALISAMAEYGDAYGIYSGGGGTSIHTGDVNGVIIAEADDGSWAYGMYSNTSIMTGNIGSDANITATADGWHAVGLYSGDGDIDTNDIDGKISASVGELYAYGLHSEDGDINTDDIGSTAVITATSARSRAYGLYSEDGDINTGAINGTITATAGGNYAYGLYSSGDGSINIGDVNGVITASADYQAYGLFSEGSSTITTGDINGTISATSATETAYGLRSWGDIVTGDIAGAITATSAERKAAGIFNEGTLTTTVSGSITAYSDADFVYGILSYGPMDVLIDGGDVNAVADGGPYAAAIQSGRMGSLAIGLVTQDANDTVEIVAGSTIVGDIDLAMNGTDNDLLTLSGVDSNSTTFADDINNVETINVTGGTFYVNGTVDNSTNGITVYDGVLGGSGDLLCDLYVTGGIFAPGNSIDTINIGGDWTHDPNGIYEVEVDKNENADLAIVDGTTYLDGTIRGKVYGDRIDHSFSALVIDSNGLSGVFADVNGTTLFPIYSVSYDTDNNDVYLGVLFDYAYYARTPNQTAVGHAFNQIVSSGRDTGDMNDVLTAIENLPDGEAVNEAYNQLMPQDMLGLPDVTRRIMGTHNDGIMEQMDNRRRARQYTMLENNRYLLADAGDPMALLSETGQWMPFVKGIGMWADRDSERDIAGYKYSVYGAIAGMDKQVSENSIMGFGIGGLTTSVDYTRGSTKADIDSVLLSLHGSYFTDNWHLDYTAGYGHSWYDQQRGITFLNRTAKSDHKSDAFTFEVEYGQNLGGSDSILEPVAGMGYTFVREGGYTESDAGAANLKVDSETYDSFYTKLGVQATTEMQFENNPNLVMVPKLSAFWVHDFADRVEVSSSFTGGGSFTTEGLDPVRDMFNIGAGLDTYFNNNARVFVDYVWQFSSDFESHMLQAGIQWPF